MMPYCRAETANKSDTGPNALAEKGEQMKEDAREHIEDMVSAADTTCARKPHVLQTDSFRQHFTPHPIQHALQAPCID